MRTLARNPGFAAIALVSLALGIGANTAIFRLTDAVLLRALPVRNPEELLVIRGGFSYPRFEEFRRRQEVFSGIVGVHTLRNLDVSMDGQPLGVISGELVSGNYFSLLGVGTVIGRPFGIEDNRVPEQSPVAVISHGLWKRAFALSPDVLGRKLTVQPGGQRHSQESGIRALADGSRHHAAASLRRQGRYRDSGSLPRARRRHQRHRDRMVLHAAGWAAREGKKEMVEWLLKKGARRDLPEDEPWALPAAWAKRRGHREIVELCDGSVRR